MSAHAKHCRYCNARIPDNRDWLENYCCEDHRDLFQARQHRETVERLRREEPNEHIESELALHTFEPRRVRVAMLGAQEGSIGDRGSALGSDNSSYISRKMPPPVYTQPLVAPPLRPKASVEHGLAALSLVSEPVSQPLQLHNGSTNGTAQPETLGAAVRRATPVDGGTTTPGKNVAIVNLIRGARQRMADPEVAAGVLLAKKLQQPQDVAPSNGARVRSIAVTIPPARAMTPSAQTTQLPPSRQIAAPNFQSGGSAEGTLAERYQRIGIFVAVASTLIAFFLVYFLFAGR